MFAITGATGRVGRRVASRLAKLGVPQRLIVRDRRNAPILPDVEVMEASAYSDVVAMGKALKGIQTLFLVSARDRFGVAQNSALKRISPPPYDRVQEHMAAIDAAAAVGVQRIIYLSFLNSEPDATFVLAQDHYYTEEYIRHIGLPFTFLRMNLYTDRVPFYVSSDDVIRVPAGAGKVSWVTRDDLADVAVAVLTGSGHDGFTYDVTGPEALTMAETADALSGVTGRKIAYQAQTPHQVRATHRVSGFEKLEAERIAMTGTGFTEYDIQVCITHFLQIATGELSLVSDIVPRLTGHPAQSLTDYLKNYPESYQNQGIH
jgi:NAD(P)H dehydrogenase (quinone)